VSLKHASEQIHAFDVDVCGWRETGQAQGMDNPGSAFECSIVLGTSVSLLSRTIVLSMQSTSSPNPSFITSPLQIEYATIGEIRNDT